MVNRLYYPGSETDRQAGGGGTPESDRKEDLTDSSSDRERLKQDISYTELPEVSDIPGQEQITNIGPLGEMADTTAASDDEEGIRDGKDVTGGDDTEIVMGTEADVTKEDLLLLGDRSEDMDAGELDGMAMEGLDDEDMDGDPLNEAASDLDTPGDDLDLPAAEDTDPGLTGNAPDDDEENDYYSTPDQGDDLNIEPR